MDSKTTLPTWDDYLSRLNEKLKKGRLEDFLKWDFIKESMFHEIHSDKYDYLIKHPRYEDFKAALVEDDFGRPNRYYLDQNTSGNLLHHVYSFLKFCEATGYDIRTKKGHIFEFGGGYGSFCRMMFKNGFEGSYTIYDLPSFSWLQTAYLNEVNKNLITLLNPANLSVEPKHINLINRIEWQFIKSDLLVALWSLSEAPLELRDLIFNTVYTDYYLIAYQKNFEGINNEAYFDNFILKHPEFEFKKEDIFDLPHCNYLFGKRK